MFTDCGGAIGIADRVNGVYKLKLPVPGTVPFEFCEFYESLPSPNYRSHGSSCAGDTEQEGFQATSTARSLCFDRTS